MKYTSFWDINNVTPINVTHNVLSYASYITLDLRLHHNVTGNEKRIDTTQLELATLLRSKTGGREVQRFLPQHVD